MTARMITLILFAFGAALATAYMANNWIASERAALSALQPRPQTEAPALRVMVADADMTAGTFLKAGMLRWQSWPDENLSPAYLVKGEHGIGEMTGAVLRSRITAGQPVTEAQVVKPGERGFLAAVLSPGMRAVSVAINATTGISGFIFPGDRVDLLLTQTIKRGESKRRVSETVLSGIRVLAVDQRIENEDSKAVVAKTATLEVTPKQAEVIAVASDLGRLSLSLLSLGRADLAEEAKRKPTWGRDISLALGSGAKRASSVSIMRGGKRETTTF